MRICSITPHQLMNNPRILREADALAAAGHNVRVVSVKRLPDQSARDGSLTSGRAWRLDTIDIERTPAGRRTWLVTGIRQKTASALFHCVGRGAYLAGLAYARTFSETIRLVVAAPVDLIIAHTQPMLAPACFAADRLGCRWGFDCEDILSEEYGEGISDPAHQALVRYIETTFIPQADYVTVASPEFATWLRDHYGVQHASFIANVPSLGEAPEAPRPGYPVARPYLSLYWFSMSVGPLRGLEDAIRALPLIEVPVQLHIRGRLLPGFGSQMQQLIQELGLGERVVLHDLVAPQDTVAVASEHDVGLVLTQPCCENHKLQVPNKLYAYMMAGLAIATTSTRGLRRALAEAPGVGFEYEPGNHVEFAERINSLAREPVRLHECRQEAFRLARARFNWELEQQRLVDIVAHA